jgi:hypothetical protein
MTCAPDEMLKAAKAAVNTLLTSTHTQRLTLVRRSEDFSQRRAVRERRGTSFRLPAFTAAETTLVYIPLSYGLRRQQRPQKKGLSETAGFSCSAPLL